MASANRFVYFDLGNVLLYFDHAIACRNMAKLAQIDAEIVRRIVFDEQLEYQYERGDITTWQFYEAFCEATGTCPDYQALQLAASDIFQLNTSIVPIVERLKARGCRLGVLSNTCECHWQLCWERFPLVRQPFDVHALSFQLNRMKPEPEIYLRAAELAGVRPQEIFFTDDRPDNVAAAAEAGYDTVLFESSEQLAHALQQRGLLA